MKSSTHKIALLGSGAWGTAIAHLLADNGHQVLLWAHEPEVALEINTHHTNSYYLPDLILPKNITATASLQEALAFSDTIGQAIPMLFLRQTLSHALSYDTLPRYWFMLTKGIEQSTALLPTQLLQELWVREREGEEAPFLAVVSGPSFARELVEQRSTAVMVAAAPHDKQWIQELSLLLSNDYFHCSPSDDLIGVQLTGALKNVIALMMGIIKGAGGGDNTRAWLLTNALQEMAAIARAYGASEASIYSLAGLGDLVLTSLGGLSKNMHYGMRIGQGEFLTREGVMPEGVNTLQAILPLLKKKSLRAPLIEAVYQIVFQEASVCSLEKALLASSKFL